MRNFRVNVNGRIYDVSVDELAQSNNQAIQQLQPQPVMEKESTITQQETSAVKASSPVSLDAGDKPVVAPLSGVIIDLKVKPGDQVKFGQVLLTLEALKMENEIVAPEAGMVKATFVQIGSSVNVGDVLLTLV
jgi:glutaconyl-CoA/methylmalonyl-CoA decarboxylase subunit gamma